MGISLPHALIYQPWCSCAHLLSWTSASRGLPPHKLSHLPAVGLMRSSAVVGIVLSRSAPSPTLSLSSTSSGAHALTCCRGHRPLEVSSLPDSLIYQLWCSCAHLLSWTSSSRGLSLPHTLSSTSCGAHALICCRGHPPLVVCPLPHALSHLLAVVLMRPSAVVDIVPSWPAPSPHTLSHLLAVGLMRSSAIVDIVLSRSTPSPHTLSLLLAVGLSRVGERAPSP